jgi:bifunctional non-homologous end joining protein LigD
VTIWDAGYYRTEKWRDDEVIVVLHGRRAQGRYVLVRTDGSNWLMHRMKDQSGVDEAPDSGDEPSPELPRPGRAALPRDLAPMLATPGEIDRLGDGDWRLEGKWDGIRAIAEVDHGRLRVHSRAGNDVTALYHELSELADELAEHAVVLDGEIVALADNGAPSFERLQRRMGVTRPRDVRAAAAEVPARYYVFDLLYVDGVSLLRKSYDDRRRLLEALHIDTEHCEVPERLTGSPADALAKSRRRNLEGIVAKRADSTYQPGRRSGAWIKVKLWATQDVVVVGWRPGRGRREGGIGSLLLALPGGDGAADGGRSRDGDAPLVYAGRVGTGFTDAMLDRLLERLKPLRRKTSPVADSVSGPDARDVVWVTPSLVGEVSYSEITRDGRLRQPAWRGLREDVPVDQVRREG